MQALIFPDALFVDNKEKLKESVLFYNYKVSSESQKKKVIFRKNIFNFIISGRKTIQTLNKTYSIDSSQIVLIKEGNCITAEQHSQHGNFNSLTLYFDTKLVNDFLVKFSDRIPTHPKDTCHNVYTFEKDPFIESFINSICFLMKEENSVEKELSYIKFEEIMLYLLHKEGTTFIQFINNMVSNRKDIDFKIKMESESLNKLTLEEMAFLCNMSLSSFKRNFLNTYGISPQKWFQNKRLQFAYEALKSNTKTPSDLYLELGYSSLSSFSTAFTNIYGIPPTKVLQKNDHL